MFATLNLVAAGLGVSIVPASMQRLRMDGVVYCRLKGAPASAPIRLAYRRADDAPALRRFIDLVRATVTAGASGRWSSSRRLRRMAP